MLKIGTEGAYPPFNNLTADGKLEGFDIDIAKALCDEMKVKCEFVTQDWDGIIPALQAGKFDAIIASMSITPSAREKVDFTNKYYNTPPAIAAPKDTDIKGVTKEDLAGKTIGVATSTTHFNYAEKTYTDSTIKGYPSSQEYQLDLANGRLDAVKDDIVVLQQWLDTPDGACCKLIGTIKPRPVEIHGPGAGIAVRKGETDLVDKFNAAINAIRANGKYKEINDKYFKFDVYGGEFLISTIEAAARHARRRSSTGNRLCQTEDSEPMQSVWTLLSWGPEGWLDDIASGVLVTVCPWRWPPCRSALRSASSSPWPSSPSEPSLRLAGNIYTTIFRGLPELVTLFLVYFGAPDRAAAARAVRPSRTRRSRSTASSPA